jgi:ubiquinone/menaquinone biosynthesis C-methylase UbiE
MKEIKRVLKPGGRVITINPVSWPFHEAPIDCWRIFPSGIRALAGESDMEIVLNLFESLEVAHIRDRDEKAVVIPGMSYNYLSSDGHLSTIVRW